METNFENIVEKVIELLRTEARTEAVIGNQFQLGEFLCVPVIRIGLGFGSGSGSGDDPKKGKGSGGGVGGGTGVEPIAFLVTRGDQISLLSVKKEKGLSAIFDKVPDLIEKINAMKKDAKERESTT